MLLDGALADDLAGHSIDKPDLLDLHQQASPFNRLFYRVADLWLLVFAVWREVGRRQRTYVEGADLAVERFSLSGAKLNFEGL